MEGFFEEEEDDWGSPISHLIAGGIAGTVEHCGMYPVDTLKVFTFNTKIILHKVINY